jgi:hypothetical protein
VSSRSHIEPAWVTVANRLGRDLAAELLAAAGSPAGPGTAAPKPAPFTAQPRGSEL